MRRFLVLMALTAVGLILVLTFRTRVPDAPTARTSAPSISRPASTSPAAPVAPAPRTTALAFPPGTHSVKGDRVATAWGFVQVRVSVVDRRIVDVAALETPHGNPTDIDINRDAVPKLRAAAVAAQSADIDTISGATVTSNGYRDSLQSALDRLLG
jgi:uncharacterized protein with FMN-binding domain